MKNMMKHLRRRFRKDQAGQSIVLLAFAFIALAAFVGLVTDISVLFVRYSTLSRTIDSAAVAAAGQIREGTDYGTVALTAKQFIQLHGLEPSRVWVETCETDILAWRTGTGIFEGQGANPEASDPPDTSISDVMPETELCDWDTPRKLVRVRAQIDSETFFLQLLGIDTLTLEASSVSETAVLDIALVLDTSQSMAEETTVGMYDSIYGGGIYPRSSLSEPRVDCFFDPATDDPASDSPDEDRWRYGPCCNDPGQGEVVLDEGTGQWVITGITSPSDTVADGNYSDLICHPFRDVKDAARNFILSLDFVRGDRVSLVQFDSEALIVRPVTEAPNSDIVMMANEALAIETLNQRLGVNPQNYLNGVLTDQKTRNIRSWGNCVQLDEAVIDWYGDPGEIIPPASDPTQNLVVDNTNVNPLGRRIASYETTAPCPDTNIGGGIRAANDALTNLATIRRDAVWVIILLTDGAANRTDAVPDIEYPEYGYYGFCPWYTFCDPEQPDHPNKSYTLVGTDPPVRDTYANLDGSGAVFGGAPGQWRETFPFLPDAYDPADSGTDRREECPDTGAVGLASDTQGFERPFCNDNNPDTRHFCLEWTGNPDTNGRPDLDNPVCTDLYDADDYARDWADFAGLINLTDNVPGNFITIFTIGFGEALITTGPNEATSTSAPLLRYIADAGDNGVIDTDLQQDWRDDGANNGSVPAQELGDPDPCEAYPLPGQEDIQCGNYFYADDLSSVDAVFEAIASRLFTRIAR